MIIKDININNFPVIWYIFIRIIYYLIKIYKGCSRTSKSACIDATNRKSCLKSSESRSSEQFKGLIHGSNCAWCPSGPCSAEGKHRCEAESVLEASNVEAYETCYEGMKMDTFFSDNTFKGALFIFWDFV